MTYTDYENYLQAINNIVFYDYNNEFEITYFYDIFVYESNEDSDVLVLDYYCDGENWLTFMSFTKHEKELPVHSFLSTIALRAKEYYPDKTIKMYVSLGERYDEDPEIKFIAKLDDKEYEVFKDNGDYICDIPVLLITVDGTLEDDKYMYEWAEFIDIE